MWKHVVGRARQNVGLETLRPCGMDGEIASMVERLARVSRGSRVLVLADSKVAIAVVRKASRTGKARSHHLKKVVDNIAALEERDGRGAVKLVWVKAHVDILVITLRVQYGRQIQYNTISYSGRRRLMCWPKQAAEGVSPDDLENGCLGEAIGSGQSTESRSMCREGGGRGDYQESDGVEKESRNELLPATGKEGHWKVVGQ